MQNSFAFGVVDLVGLDGDFLLADTLLDFELVGEVGALLDDILLVAKLEVGVVLLFGGDPAVADEEAREVPFVIDGASVLVAFENSLSDVGNVLTGVRLSGNVELRIWLDRIDQEVQSVAPTSSCSYSGNRANHLSKKVTKLAAISVNSWM